MDCKFSSQARAISRAYSALLRSKTLIIACISFSFLVLAATYLQPYVDQSVLLRDPAAVAISLHELDHTPIYYGFISNLGILIWTVACWVPLFTAYIALKRNRKDQALFLFHFGFLSCLLVVDDFFMLHELVIPYLWAAIIDGDSRKLAEYVMYIFCLGMLIMFLYSFRTIIWYQEPVILVLSLTSFAVSVIIDGIYQSTSILVEDGAKLFGITFWSAYSVQQCLNFFVGKDL